MKSTQSLREQADKLYLAVGIALSAWNSVEWALSRLFAQSLSPQTFDPASSSSVSEAAYWSVASVEARINMLDVAMTEAHFADAEVTATWSNLHNRIGKGRKMRNKIAHGTVVQKNQGQPDGSVKQSVYFSAFYWSKEAKSGRQFIPATEPRAETLTEREIQESAERFQKLADEMHALTRAIYGKMRV